MLLEIVEKKRAEEKELADKILKEESKRKKFREV
jgi:hypothetical protein